LTYQLENRSFLQWALHCLRKFAYSYQQLKHNSLFCTNCVIQFDSLIKINKHRFGAALTAFEGATVVGAMDAGTDAATEWGWSFGSEGNIDAADVGLTVRLNLSNP
jgi:hypothetical protein